MRETIVVKCGGNATVDPVAVCEDIAGLIRDSGPVVLVHGGSADIERLAARLGVESRRLIAPDGVSARHTDAAMLEVVHLALAGMTKPRLVSALAAAGASPVGLTGLDGRLLRARRKLAHRSVVDGRRIVVRDDHSGRITEVNSRLLRTLLADGHVPVVSPPAVAEDGRPVNTDADRAAAAVAVALKASTLVLLTGAPGVLRDPGDDDSVMPVCTLAPSGPPPFTGGGMGLKLIAAREALHGGVDRVLIAHGGRRHPVRAALNAQGTRVVLGKPAGDSATATAITGPADTTTGAVR